MTCPICGAPTSRAFRPFCSKRCQQIDLGRWMTGGYAIPVLDEEPAKPEDEADPPPTRRH